MSIRAPQRAGSADGAPGLASSLSEAGCSRFLSRSCMNSSYFAVPGLGGASAGMPPAQCGMASLIPAASLSLMDPHPLRPHEASVTARAMARWRVRTDICLRSQPCLVSSSWGAPPIGPPMDPACPRRRSSRLFQPNVTVALIKLCLLTALGIMMPRSAQ